MQLSSANRQWLADFLATHHRAPRVLHIGNIANNAYLNAKFLNNVGFECDVLCYDYYHIMACPEWEDADFSESNTDPNRPDWTQVNLNGFKRPGWFAQGPLSTCLDYLIARRSGDTGTVRTRWLELACANKTIDEAGALELGVIRQAEIDAAARATSQSGDRETSSQLKTIWNRFARLVRGFGLDEYPLQRLADNPKLKRLTNRFFPLGHISVNLIAIGVLLWSVVCKLVLLPYYVFKSSRVVENDIDIHNAALLAWGKNLEARFNAALPAREDSLQIEDVIGYYDSLPKLRRLFQFYDLVHGYATDGIFALLAEFPYVAYEHGTIRSTPFEKTSQGRLCAITYKLADYVCITNADNIVAAKALSLDRCVFVPHPINEDVFFDREAQRDAERSMHLELESNFLIFHPARHHWGEERHPNWEKGNDIFIRGFARFVTNVNRNAKAVFVDWGMTVDKSKALIAQLGVGQNVIWIAPQTAKGMAKYIQSTDLLADQFYLGAFGSTLPRALACGKPAMICLNTKLHEWCFDEMPPVINAGDEASVFNGLVKVYRDDAWVIENAIQGRNWYQAFHSSAVIVKRLTNVYRSVIASRHESSN